MNTPNTPITAEDRAAQADVLSQIFGPSQGIAGQIHEVLRRGEQDEADGVDMPTIVLHGKPE